MKNLIKQAKSQQATKVIGLIVLAAICLTLILLVAYYGNGVISTDFIIR